MLDGYEDIIRKFSSGQISADEFESSFLAKFKHDQNQVPSREFEILDSLFADVDEYVADAELRESVGGISADVLRDRAQSVYRRLYG
ncbi:hypothetical protein B7C42_02772 [Nocardia cerradoensis]|uniref:Colicin D immunity protein domain-containing protein n=1 Tax=Nocardia cerradoensis TaxID=85688 RepID=A0A231H7J6_9NOCA|nr:colicin immunity domain-containing protein [Nocardia cerradoensis]OXR44818.1 hypothetical protein B7C42_02772 [Nocardia cerradoensis]